MPQCLVLEIDFIENFGIRHENGFCSRFFCFSCHLKFCNCFSPFITLPVYFSVSFDFNHKPFRKRIDYRSSNTMESSRNLVSSASEFSACMKNCVYYFDCRFFHFFMHVDRHSAPIVCYGYGIVSVYGYFYAAAVSGQGLIYAVVHYFIHQMVKPSFSSGSYIHARPFSYRLQTFQNLYLFSVIFLCNF